MYWHAASCGVVRARRLVSLWLAFRCCCALGGFAAVLGAVVVRRWVVSGLGLPLRSVMPRVAAVRRSVSPGRSVVLGYA
jgi:hypothetical protein